MRVTIIATGFDKNVEGATTVEAPAAPAAPAKDAAVKPGVVIGRVEGTPVAPVTPVTPTPVVQPVAEAPKKDEGTISDSDFDDIMDILRKSKGRSDFRNRR